jgi:sugar lactone lactonase YvrE
MRKYLALLAIAALSACGEDPPTGQPDASASGPCPLDRKGVICSWAGTGEAGVSPDGTTIGESLLNEPADVVFDKENTAYVVDRGNHLVRRVKADGTIETVLGNGSVGDGALDRGDYADPGAEGASVAVQHPTDALVMPDGRLVVACWSNHKLRRLDPATGLVRIIAGTQPCSAVPACSQTTPPRNGDGVEAIRALFDYPSKLAVNTLGEIFVVDQREERIRRIDRQGIIATIAGKGDTGYFGDNGNPPQPSQAWFHFDNAPQPKPSGGLAFDDQGNLYVADSLNHRIRKIEFVQSTTSSEILLKPTKISLFAGQQSESDLAPGYSGDGGPAIGARLNTPTDIAIGGNKLYFADTGNNVVRSIDLSSRVIDTVAGTGGEGFAGDSGCPPSEALAAARRRARHQGRALHRRHGEPEDPARRAALSGPTKLRPGRAAKAAGSRRRHLEPARPASEGGRRHSDLPERASRHGRHRPGSRNGASVSRRRHSDFQIGTSQPRRQRRDLTRGVRRRD